MLPPDSGGSAWSKGTAEGADMEVSIVQKIGALFLHCPDPTRNGRREPLSNRRAGSTGLSSFFVSNVENGASAALPRT